MTPVATRAPADPATHVVVGAAREAPAGWPQRIRALVAPAVVAAGATGALVVVGTLSPYRSGTYPTCPLLALTGLYCPGCGSLRATHDLVNLDVVAALGMNPLTPLALLFLLTSWVAWTWRSVTGRPRRWLAPPWALWALLVVILAFAVARNTPFLAPWLAPGG
ncbi:DUF2752 domain-containing protein [Actinotalea sp. K2]|uniref:DUF2752 domain-containing protein n=1 Tax=Actinotalea sp. K2 TaxID=2939438 RepID=UPI00201814C4|nr:DUF2752 domain-containing protein [Actinotalea sp. K2]MCL3861876.1 DUF2752 domain-containing protein [Actinotalea sp. K2]